MTEEIIESQCIDAEYELATLFSEMREGYRVQLTRKEPHWASGYLGAFDWSPDDPISLEWIQQQWGGRRIQVKVFDSNNKYRGSRTVNFSEPPKRHGVELVQNPTGDPIPISHPQAQAILRGTPASPPAETSDQTLKLMTLLMNSQAKSNEQMTNLLLSRVNHLESLLEHRPTEPPPQPQYGPYPDPHSQIRQTLETIKLMDELRNAVSKEVDEDDDKGMEIYQSLIDKVIDRLTDEKPKQAAQAGSPAPPLPPPQKSQSGPLSDAAFMAEAQRRLSRLPHEQRIQLAQQLLGDEFVFEEEEQDPTHMPQKTHRQDKDEILESLLSDEDKKLIEDELDESGAGGVSDTPTPTAGTYGANGDRTTL